MSEAFYGVPLGLFVGCLMVFCVSAVFSLAFFEVKKGLRYLMFLLFIEYVLILLSSTVIYRPYSLLWEHHFMPFWSYKAILNGEKGLIIDNLLNVLVFLPIGFLSGMVIKVRKFWRVLIVGICVSVLIETLQYTLNRGVAEFDDIFHNSIGVIIGYAMFIAVAHVAILKYDS